MPPAARKTDITGHGPPIAAPGPCSLDIDIGFLPAWRALPAGVGDGLEQASDQMKQLMDKAVLTPPDATPVLVQVQVGATQSAAKAAAAGNPAGTAAVAAGFATLQATNIALTAAWTTASAVPGGQPAADTAYTQAIKAAAGATATAAFSAVAAGIADINICSIPVPPMPHGPGVVTKGSGSVFFNNLPAARQGDKLVEACGGSNPISKGEMSVEIGD